MTKKSNTISNVAKVAKVAEGQIPSAIKESAQQIWSASVDAISRAQQGSNRVFEALVREGEALRENIHKKTRKATSVSDVTARATDTWDRLEQVFESRVARALATLGVPNRGDLQALNKRIDDLTKLVRQQAGSESARKTPLSTPAVPKPAAKSRAKKPSSVL
ncbi:MAG: phasin family protein [Rhodocyclaceae bacterium]|nr:phasin family protein [Rhodocyclaceae bacterium]MBK6906925.1 phasin family protein [Rhodocyclaceae bacterium]